MQEEKNAVQPENSASQKKTNPGDIDGKIEVPDTRERRDGPGGN